MNFLIPNEEKKLTDKEIIKALECCSRLNYSNFIICKTECPYKGKCFDEEKGINFNKDICDLINRLKTESLKYRYKAQIQKGELARLNKLVAEQKAEIERLEIVLKNEETQSNVIFKKYKTAKADGVRLLGIHLLDKSKNGRIKSSEIVDGVYEVLNELS